MLPAAASGRKGCYVMCGCGSITITSAARKRSFFFFQAEECIRDATVTGVQTCALPISPSFKVIELLERRGAVVSLADPWADPARFPVRTWSPKDGPISDFDIVVLLTDHAEFTDELIKDATRVLYC